MKEWLETAVNFVIENKIHIAAIIFVAVAVLSYLVKILVKHRLAKLAKRTKTDVDDLIVETLSIIGWPLYVVLGLYLGIFFTGINGMVRQIASYIAIVVITYYGARVVNRVIEYAKDKIIHKRGEDKESSLIVVLAKIVKVLVWIIAFLLIISNFGYDITSLIAGFGIGGIAIAFALQNILSDIFSSFSIYFDKPFQVGDFIIIGNDMGVVRKIGIKSTRLQTLQGQELVVSNKELTETRVNNYKRMERRRIAFNLGLTYSTTSAKIKKALKIVEDSIGNIKKTEFDRVHFSKFGDFALIFEVVYYINSSDYKVYMDIQQEINLNIKKEFEKAKIEMAFPTQTLHIKKEA